MSKEELVSADGTKVVWESRWHRKHPRAAKTGSTWWAPRAIAWWIGVLFAIGSACFALSALPAYADGVGTNSDNLTYFIGSIFFTSAAFLQYFETATTNPQLDRPKARRFRQLLEVQHQRIDWWASLVQLIGTLWFNRTTFSALVVGLGASAMHHPVWRPDALGSICFRVSSWFAWGRSLSRELRLATSRPRLVDHAPQSGCSIAFGVSAVASYVKPNGSLVSLALTNLGTFFGATCFLVGGLLLLPERTASPQGISTSRD